MNNEYTGIIESINKSKQNLCQLIFDKEIEPILKRYKWRMLVGMGTACFTKNGVSIENKTITEMTAKVDELADNGSLMENGFYHGLWWVCSSIDSDLFD